MSAVEECRRALDTGEELFVTIRAAILIHAAIAELLERLERAEAKLALADKYRRIEYDRAEHAEAENDALKREAQSWAQEAKTQRSTVQESYQVATGATGEPGDWRGAEPIRELRVRLEQAEAALAEAQGVISALECGGVRIVSAGGSWTLSEFIEQIRLARHDAGGEG